MQRDITTGTKGFTLIELLIVLTILALLAVATVLVLNPAEIIKKSRDTQRISDLSTMKSALALYVTTATTPYLGASGNDTSCIDGASDKLWVSYPSDSPGAALSEDLSPPTNFTFTQVTNANVGKNDATGWMPVNFGNTGTGIGAPIGQLPTDPTNTVGTASAVVNADLIYRYGCNGAGAASNKSTFEIDAKMESSYYTTAPNIIATNDGGNNTLLYEVGTLLTILPSSDDF